MSPQRNRGTNRAQLSSAWPKLGIRVDPRAEWAWVFGRFGIIGIVLAGAILLLRDNPFFAFLMTLLAVVTLYDAVLIAFLLQGKVLFVFIIGFILDNTALMVGWIVVLKGQSDVGQTDDFYLLLFPLLIAGVVRLGWKLGSVYSLLWLGWFAGTSLAFNPLDSYQVDQLPIRLLFLALSSALVMILVARLRMNHGESGSAIREIEQRLERLDEEMDALRVLNRAIQTRLMESGDLLEEVEEILDEVASLPRVGTREWKERIFDLSRRINQVRKVDGPSNGNP